MSTEIAGRGAAQRSSLCVPTILLSLSPRARESESAREEREERETAEELRRYAVPSKYEVASSQFETTSTHEQAEQVHVSSNVGREVALHKCTTRYDSAHE